MQEELNTYGKVFHPFGACKRTIKTPKPYKDSFRTRKRASTDHTNSVVPMENRRGPAGTEGTLDPTQRSLNLIQVAISRSTVINMKPRNLT